MQVVKINPYALLWRFPMGRSTTLTQTVTFAGIDFHKKFSVVSLGDKDGNVIEQKKLYNDEAEIRRYFEPYRGISCAVESCRAYEWFVELLRECGLNVLICNPRQAKMIIQSRCKTDKLDSRKLMELLAKGYLPTCYLPTPEEKRLREWLRWRVSLVRNTTRLKIQIHALLDKEHKTFGKNTFSQKLRPELEAVDLTPARRQLLDRQLHVLSFLEECVATEDAMVKAEAKQHELVELLKTIPGIGDLSALLFLAEIGDCKRFRNAGQISAYLGLVPSESSSGGKRHLGSITKEGSGLMRWVLVQCAWKAIRADGELARRFFSIRKRQGKHVAIVAIARLLAEVAFHVVRDKTPFDAAKLAPR
jgi:transposase